MSHSLKFTEPPESGLYGYIALVRAWMVSVYLVCHCVPMQDLEVEFDSVLLLLFPLILPFYASCNSVSLCFLFSFRISFGMFSSAMAL